MSSVLSSAVTDDSGWYPLEQLCRDINMKPTIADIFHVVEESGRTARFEIEGVDPQWYIRAIGRDNRGN